MEWQRVEVHVSVASMRWLDYCHICGMESIVTRIARACKEQPSEEVWILLDGRAGESYAAW